MVCIDQYLSDLDAYHDDAHLDARRAYAVSGQAWEAFTYLWRDGRISAEALAARLARRGHGRDGYAAALEELAARGWASPMARLTA